MFQKFSHSLLDSPGSYHVISIVLQSLYMARATGRISENCLVNSRSAFVVVSSVKRAVAEGMKKE